MDPKELEKVADLFGHDLAGWQIAECHFLELAHGLMGRFPAIDEDKRIVMTLDKRLLEQVWKKLTRRPAKITSLMVVVHPASGVAFNLKNEGDIEPFHILSAEAVEALCQKENPVHWTQGLLQLPEQPVAHPVFA